MLGWKPKYGGLNGFKKGLEKTIKWFRDNKNLSQYNSKDYNI